MARGIGVIKQKYVLEGVRKMGKMYKICKSTIKKITPQAILKYYYAYKEIINLQRQKELERGVAMCLAELNMKRSIDLGKFLQNAEESITLPDITFIYGGSSALDYAFLKILAMKYERKNYLEIGTYIGESIRVVSTVCNRCHSVTAAPGTLYSMAEWCRSQGMPDFTERLTDLPNIVHHHVEDSKLFDYSSVEDVIDLYFIDGDHRYDGVYADTKKVFSHKSDDAIVVWHDFKGSSGLDGSALAVHDALGPEEWENVFCVDNNVCGVYLPKKYQVDLPLRVWEWTEARQPLYVYETTLKIRKLD